MQQTKWPDGFMDIGGLTFAQTYQLKPEWVDFTLTDMKDASGMFKEWRSYCIGKKTDDIADSDAECIGTQNQTHGSSDRKR